MSRTNPYKKKKRFAKQTLLIFCEGLEDCVFLKHVRALYSYDQNISCKIIAGKGGNARSIVVEASKVPGDYTKRIVVLDNDKTLTEMQSARDQSTALGILLIENTRCLESLFLTILRDKQDFLQKTSSWCKKEFETAYIHRKKRDDRTLYMEIFPKAFMDRRRKKVPGLDILIRLFESS